MSKQLSLGEGFQKYAKTTRRSQFLSEMDVVVPWAKVCGLVEPFYPVAGNGRPPRPLELMVRVYFLQQWFNLSDPAAEDALYDSDAMRRFVGLDLSEAPAPDETTLCKFRHLLERHRLGEAMFECVLEHLDGQGLKIGLGTIVDATVISAPQSLKNKDQQRDPQMRSGKKGNLWYFGMKAHIGVDSETKLIHSVVVTPGNVHDSRCIGDLLHGNEQQVWGDAAYMGQTDVILAYAPQAQDLTNRRWQHRTYADEAERVRNREKSRIRARVEHPFLVIKQLFGFAKTRYRGLVKNTHRLLVTCALTNLYLVRRRLLQII